MLDHPSFCTASKEPFCQGRKWREAARDGQALKNLPEDLSHISISGLMSDQRVVNNHRLTKSKTLADNHVHEIRSISI
jgi:hypothetical protein